MNSPYRVLDQLIADTRRLNVNPEQRDKLLAPLLYLRTQTICDRDRMHKQDNHEGAWREVEKYFEQFKFKEQFKKPENFYEPVINFFGIRPKLKENYSFVDSHPKPKPTKQEQNKFYEDWEPDKIFEEILKDSDKIRSLLTRILIRSCVGYLLQESKKLRMHRSKMDLKVVWKFIQPYLRRNGLLDKFDARKPKSTILFFIKDGF